MKQQEKTKKQLRFRFMAMSKLIGIIAFCFVLIVTVYTMYEMHISRIYDALPQLILSAFGFASVYAGFYLTMAKVEHLEAEKTKREMELQKLQINKGVDDTQVAEKQQQINDIVSRLTELMSEQSSSLL